MDHDFIITKIKTTYLGASNGLVMIKAAEGCYECLQNIRFLGHFLFLCPGD